MFQSGPGRSLVSLSVVLIVCGSSQVHAQDMEDVQVEASYVAGGIYMLTGQGGNIGLSVGEDGPFLIDDQYAPLTEKVRMAIAAITDGEVEFVLNTHWHGDHTGGNENLGATGTLIVAHENVRRRMQSEQFQELFNRRTPASPDGALPVITFTDAATFHWNDETIRAVHVAHAHTDGDAIIYFETANVFHMGDTFWNGLYPFIDVSSGGSIHGMIEAANRVLSLATSNSYIIPGHGPIGDVDDLRAYRDMLVNARDRIQTLINDGFTEDEIVRRRPTAATDEQWGGGFINPEQFARLTYRGLVATR